MTDHQKDNICKVQEHISSILQQGEGFVALSGEGLPVGEVPTVGDCRSGGEAHCRRRCTPLTLTHRKPRVHPSLGRCSVCWEQWSIAYGVHQRARVFEAASHLLERVLLARVLTKERKSYHPPSLDNLAEIVASGSATGADL